MDFGELALERREWTAVRLSLPIPGSFHKVVAAFEQAVPEYPVEEFRELAQVGAPWTDVLASIDAVAPLGFMLYWKNDLRPIMALAGDDAACVSYLMGNEGIAEKMYRHDARVMNYAPLRIEFTNDSTGTTWLTVDQPSSQFGSFDHLGIERVGYELDEKLATLIRHLGGTPPRVLMPSR